MKAICVDDELLAVRRTVRQCEQMSLFDEVKGFTSAREALEDLKVRPADIALLDIDMPETDGITLAAEMKKICPEIAVLFLTAYKQYAYDAFAVHPNGYLLKPVSQEALAREAELALAGRSVAAKHEKPHITVQTFGGFDVFVDGEKMVFKRARAKELLAYLIDRNGRSVKRATAFAALWGDQPYGYSMQKQFDVVIRSLRSTLEEYGISELLKNEHRELWLVTEGLDCDLYRFLRREPEALSAWRGEYMSDYTWASQTEGYLERMYNGFSK